MKQGGKIFLLLFFLLVFSGCGIARLKLWHPVAGTTTEAELNNKWGRSCDITTHQTGYGTTKICWYSLEPITGIIFPKYYGRSNGVPVINFLIRLENGIVTSVSTR